MHNMSTDKEIRQFIRENMPEIKGGDKFMAELVRQIDILPVPASLTGKSEADIRTAMDMIAATARRIKRRNRIKAFSAAAVMSVLLGAVLAVYYLVPDIRLFVQQHFVYVLAGFAAVVLAAALLGLRHYRV